MILNAKKHFFTFIHDILICLTSWERLWTSKNKQNHVCLLESGILKFPKYKSMFVPCLYKTNTGCIVAWLIKELGLAVVSSKGNQTLI